ncbi:hypothetical protein PM082_022152 [Marasmius tenuissimus]|nr:hypothetical protein PM082_022152 [Marasmius tenuissimus]
MARFNYLALVYVFLAACAVNVSQSAPVYLAERQSDEPTRVIISGRPSENKTGQAGNAGNQTDPTRRSLKAKAVSEAKEGVKTAGVAIQGILTALIAGETPPADGRNQTDKGLGIMLTSIKGLGSDDEDVKTTLLKIEDTIAAGDEVVATCR